MEQLTGSKLGKENENSLFILYAEYIIWNAWLDESQTGIRIAGRNINNLGYADDTTLMVESEDERKNLLMRVKDESEKSGLKFNIPKTKIIASRSVTSWQIEGEKVEAVINFIFLGCKITEDGDSRHEIKRCLLLRRKAMTNLDSELKNRHHFAQKGPCGQSYCFPSSHVLMWNLDHKEGWAWKIWCFWIVVLEKTLGRSFDYEEIKPVNQKGNQPWIFIRRTDTEAEAAKLWPHCVNSQLIGKVLDAEKDWGQNEKVVVQDGRVTSYHQFNEHEFEQTMGDSEGQGSMVCCGTWSHKVSDMTQRLKSNKNKSFVSFAIMFSHSEDCILILFIVSFSVQKLFEKSILWKWP